MTKIWILGINYPLTILFKRFIQKVRVYESSHLFYSGLTHYWPFSVNLNDVVGNAHGTMSSTPVLVNDKDNFPSSSLSLRLKYVQLPSDYYISGDYTITAWVKLYSYKSYAKLVDFGNEAGNNEIIFSLSFGADGLPYQDHYINSNKMNRVFSSKKINLYEWCFVTCIFDKSQGRIYLNGILIGSGSMVIPKNVTRTTNYIGKSLWPDDEIVDADINELMIYNTALNSDQLKSIMESGKYIKLWHKKTALLLMNIIWK